MIFYKTCKNCTYENWKLYLKVVFYKNCQKKDSEIVKITNIVFEKLQKLYFTKNTSIEKITKIVVYKIWEIVS